MKTIAWAGILASVVLSVSAAVSSDTGVSVTGLLIVATAGLGVYLIAWSSVVYIFAYIRAARGVPMSVVPPQRHYELYDSTGCLYGDVSGDVPRRDAVVPHAPLGAQLADARSVRRVHHTTYELDVPAGSTARRFSFDPYVVPVSDFRIER